MYSEEPNPKRDMVTALQQEGTAVYAKLVEVVMMGGPLDGRTYMIAHNGEELELLDPYDSHQAIREGRAPKLMGLYKRFGRSMIWQKEYDDAFNRVQQVPLQIDA